MNTLYEQNLLQFKGLCVRLLYLLVFLAPLGRLIRLPGTNFFALGPTTVIVVSLILYGIFSKALYWMVLKQKMWLLVYGFGLVALITGMFQTDMRASIIRVGYFWGYTSLGLFVVALDLNRKQILNLVFFGALGMSLTVLLSLVDYYGIRNIAYVNDSMGSLEVTGEKVRIKSLSGPFRSRSELSAFLCVLLPACFGYVILGEAKKWKRNMVTIAIALGCFAVILAGSRGMYLALIATFAYIAFVFFRKMDKGQVLKIVALASIGFAVLFYYQGDYLTVVVNRLTSLSAEDVSESEGDMVRIYALEKTLKELVYQPWGLGFSKVWILGRAYDVHSIFTEFLRAAGVIGVCLILAFILEFRRWMKKAAYDRLKFVFFPSLIGFLVYNISHSYWQVTVLWVFMGCYVSVIKAAVLKQVMIDAGDMESVPEVTVKPSQTRATAWRPVSRKMW